MQRTCRWKYCLAYPLDATEPSLPEAQSTSLLGRPPCLPPLTMSCPSPKGVLAHSTGRFSDLLNIPQSPLCPLSRLRARCGRSPRTGRWGAQPRVESILWASSGPPLGLLWASQQLGLPCNGSRWGDRGAGCAFRHSDVDQAKEAGQAAFNEGIFRGGRDCS